MNQTLSKARVLVVEDERDIRDLMALQLAREGIQATVVEDGEKGLQQLSAGGYDLAVLDWMLPGMSGLELCRKFAGKLPILMLTARADTSDVVLGLEMGADDYVTKPFDVPVFLARVRALLRRGKGAHEAPGAALQLGDLRIEPELHRVLRGSEELKLTLSEFRLLQALVESRGKVLSRQKLIDCVQGPGVSVTDRTVDTHVFGLRKKLGDSADLIETIRGVGYRVKTE